jgi:hypothetical protein
MSAQDTRAVTGGRRAPENAPSLAIDMKPCGGFCCRAHGDAPKWNVSSGGLGNTPRIKPVLREQMLLEIYAFRNGVACTRAVQVLTDVAALSRAHDSCGLLQMPLAGVPGIADVVHVLLHAYALLDAFLLVCRSPLVCSMCWDSCACVALRTGRKRHADCRNPTVYL